MGRFTHPLTALRRVRVLPRWVRRVDRRAAARINGHRRLPQFDRALARLSHAADRSRLWLVIAAVLCASGGRRRRGAVRGVASLVVGSVLANLVGKQVFGGERPLLKDVPVPRRLKTFPTSASFPSGHSASAAAFVTGVALESPRTGAVLAPLGVAVAYSRLHTGAHWLSDVIGGAALGVAVALTGRMLFAARPRTGPEPSVTTIELPRTADGAGVLIFANRMSGVDPLRPDPVDFLAEHLPAARVHVLDDGDDIGKLITSAGSDDQPPAVVGIWGGDGTAAAAADAARRAALPLLVFPGGTFNHFARTAGTATLDQTLEALHGGVGHRVDVAELELDGGAPLTVLNAASVGVYPDFVAERERMQPRLGKPVAAIIAAVRVLARAETIPVTIDGRPARVWSVAVSTGQNPSASVVPLQRRSLDDALLDVRVRHSRGPMPRLRGLIALAFGSRASVVLDRVPGPSRLATIEAFEAKSVVIEAGGAVGQPVSIAHDGEVSSRLPPHPGARRSARMTIVPGGLDVYGAEG